MRVLIAVVCLTLGLAGCSEPSPWRPPGPLGPGCTLTPRADAVLRELRNFMLAQVSINGHTVTMVVDTGAEVTTLTPAAAAQLGLNGPGRTHVLHGVAGDVAARNVKVSEIRLGGQLLRHDIGVDIGELPSFDKANPPIAGLLGIDALAGFEIELDLPARRLALYNAVGCGNYSPWQDAVAVPFQRSRAGLMFVDARIGGRKVRALLDSGARTTLVARATALTLGVTEAALESDAARTGVGVGTGSVAFRQHRFTEAGLPGDLEDEFWVDIAELHLPGVEMLLGADYLGARHVWISYAMSKVFLRK